MNLLFRGVLTFAILSLGLSVSGAITLTSPVPLYDGPETPTFYPYGSSMRAAAVRDGFVVVWMMPAAIRIVHLDPAGFPRSETTVPFPASFNAGLQCASDGKSALVLAHSHDFWFTIHIAEDGEISVGPTHSEGSSFRAMVWSGSAYIALNGERVMEFDRGGRSMADIRLPSTGTFHTPAVVVTAGNVSAIDYTADGRILRAILTSEGHAVASSWSELRVSVGRNQSPLAVGSSETELYLVLYPRLGNGPRRVQYLDQMGVPSGPPIPFATLPTYDVWSGFAADGALIVMQGNSATVVRKTARGKRRSARSSGTGASPDLGDEQLLSSGQPASSASSFGYQFSRSTKTLLPIPGGAVLVAPLQAMYGNSFYEVPAITRLTVREGQVSFSEPILFDYSSPPTNAPTAAAQGDGLLVAWQQPGLFGGEIWVRRISATGVPAGPARLVGRGSGPKMASDGERTVLAWLSTEFYVLEAVRLDRDGTPIDPLPFRYRTEKATQEILHLAIDAGQVNLISYSHPAYVLARFPLSETEPLPFTSSLLAMDSQWVNYRPHGIAGAPGSTLLVGSRYQERDMITGVTLNHDLTPRAAERTISILPGGTTRLAWNGRHFVAVWWAQGLYRYSRVTSDGEPIDGEFGRVLTTSPALPNTPFQMVASEDDVVIASSPAGSLRGALGIVSIADGTTETSPLPPEIASVQGLVRGIDGTKYLITSEQNQRLAVRVLLP